MSVFDIVVNIIHQNLSQLIRKPFLIFSLNILWSQIFHIIQRFKAVFVNSEFPLKSTPNFIIIKFFFKGVFSEVHRIKFIGRGDEVFNQVGHGMLRKRMFCIYLQNKHTFQILFNTIVIHFKMASAGRHRINDCIFYSLPKLLLKVSVM